MAGAVVVNGLRIMMTCASTTAGTKEAVHSATARIRRICLFPGKLPAICRTPS